MNISMDMSALQSVRQAIGIASLRMAMNQDAQSVAAIIEGMQQANSKTMELSVTPHLGGNFDESI